MRPGMYDTLGDDRVRDAVAALRGIAQAHIGAVEDLAASDLKGRDDLKPVPAAELLERVRDGLVTVLDVRPPEECAQGHVARALNAPLDRLHERLNDLPPDRDLVANLFYNRIRGRIESEANRLLAERTQSLQAAIGAALAQSLPPELAPDLAGLRITELGIEVGEAGLTLSGVAAGTLTFGAPRSAH
jgi:rhodanese-related sulfurtransferase